MREYNVFHYVCVLFEADDFRFFQRYRGYAVLYMTMGLVSVECIRSTVEIILLHLYYIF